jgi:hypothetical protein
MSTEKPVTGAWAKETSMSATQGGAGRWWRGGALAVAVVALLLSAGDRGAAYTPADAGIDPFDILDLQVINNVVVVFDTSGSMKYAPNIPPGNERLAVGGDDPLSRFWQAKRALRDITTEFSGRLSFGMLTFQGTAISKTMVSSQDWDGSTVGRRDGSYNYVSNSPGAALWYWDPNNSAKLEYETDTYLCPTTTGGSSNILTAVANTMTVVGTGTSTPFTNLRVGDQIISNGQSRIITVKNSNSQVTVDSPVSLNGNGTTGYAFTYRVGVSGYFCDIQTTLANYDNTTDLNGEVFRSFGNRGYFAVSYPWKAANGGWGGTTPADPKWKQTNDDFGIIGYSYNAYGDGRGWIPGAIAARTPEPRGVNIYRVPECNPALSECRFYLQSRVYRTGKKYRWNLNRSTAAALNEKLMAIEDFDCSTVPPAPGLTDDTIPGARPCIVFADHADPNNADRQAVFYYSSSIWQGGGTGTPTVITDEQNANGIPVAAGCWQRPPCPKSDGSCTYTNSPTDWLQNRYNRIQAAMGLELPMAGTDLTAMLQGVPTANPATATDLSGITVATQGIRSDGGTPIASSLDWIRNNYATAFPGPPPQPQPPAVRQRNFVLVLSDGDDRTGANVALAARNLYNYNDGRWTLAPQCTATSTDPCYWSKSPSQTETILVAYTSDANANTADYIGLAGSGAVSSVNWDWTIRETWPSGNTVTCPAGATCRKAVRANNITQLRDELRKIFGSIASEGEFASARGTVTDDVYEYVALASTPTVPLQASDARTRYAASFPIVLQSNIRMPGYQGVLKAFRSGVVGPTWEAGQALKNRIDLGIGTGEWTFAELHGGAAVAPKYTPNVGAKIRRRVFTTERNGVAPAIQPLWPPTTGVAPDDPTNPPGTFDGSNALGTGLGIGDLTFDELRDQFAACKGVVPGSVPLDVPPDCLDAALQLGRARREARERILAYVAGAQVVFESGEPKRNTAGDLLFSARPWVLADSTQATPAIVGPPGQQNPLRHPREWELYINGARSVTRELLNTNAIESGFALRNPDLDDPSAGPTTLEQKPVMTVVYLGTNEALHAFRAGPQECTGPTACPTVGSENGGEELWAYVPYDLLPNLKRRMNQGQSRDNPIYGVSASLRFGDVFVPGTYSDPNGNVRDGKWRTMLYVGRGPGGKYYTGLDVTGPGPYTRNSLETQLPDVAWSRGNPDTQDGTPAGAPNVSTNPGGDLGVTDATAYARMGETWSVPALAPVNPGAGTFDKEWILWTGSGYSDTLGEGTTFYTLDALTGDALHAVDVGAATGPPTRNALVGNAASYNPIKLDEVQDNAADGPAEAVYIGDLHGRVFKFDVNALDTAVLLKSLGAGQPIGAGVTVLRIDTTGAKLPHVFGVTGNDSRVPVDPTRPFVQFGFRDDGATATDLFAPLAYPQNFRGTTQPLGLFGTFSGIERNIVFYIGTQFNEATQTNSCASSFDSWLTILNAATGTAAYDLQATGDDRSAKWTGQKVQNVTARGGKVVLDVGLGAGAAPPPPAPPSNRSAAAVPSVLTKTLTYGSTVCR